MFFVVGLLSEEYTSSIDSSALGHIQMCLFCRLPELMARGSCRKPVKIHKLHSRQQINHIQTSCQQLSKKSIKRFMKRSVEKKQSAAFTLRKIREKKTVKPIQMGS